MVIDNFETPKMNVLVNISVLLCLFSKVSSNLFCEDTIHINSGNSETEIMLSCQLGVKYSFCKIGKLSAIETDQSCTFYKSTQISTGHQTFMKQKCTSEAFIEKIEYRGIVQSDFDCIFRIRNFDATGKGRCILLQKY